jgi:hypothetical protein
MAAIAAFVGFLASLIAIFVNIVQLKKAARENAKLDLEIEKLRREVGFPQPYRAFGDSRALEVARKIERTESAIDRIRKKGWVRVMVLIITVPPLLLSVAVLLGVLMKK